MTRSKENNSLKKTPFPRRPLTGQRSEAEVGEALGGVVSHARVPADVFRISVVDGLQFDGPAVGDQLRHHEQHRANAHDAASWTREDKGK